MAAIIFLVWHRVFSFLEECLDCGSGGHDGGDDDGFHDDPNQIHGRDRDHLNKHVDILS